MPAVDIAPLMDSPRWKTLDEPTRAELKNLWQDRDTSDDDRAIMLQKMQGPAATAPVPAPRRFSRCRYRADTARWGAACPGVPYTV